MLKNSGDSIPQHQVGIYKCPTCGDGVFESINAMRFMYDKLNPDDMRPQPIPLFQCLGCSGFLTKDPKKGFIVVHREKKDETLPGDEWKG